MWHHLRPLYNRWHWAFGQQNFVHINMQILWVVMVKTNRTKACHPFWRHWTAVFLGLYSFAQYARHYDRQTVFQYNMQWSSKIKGRWEQLPSQFYTNVYVAARQWRFLQWWILLSLACCWSWPLFLLPVKLHVSVCTSPLCFCIHSLGQCMCRYIYIRILRICT